MLRNGSPPRVILGIGGGIAAYKSAELARILIQRGYKVQPVMTAAAMQFITPLTLSTLTHAKVITHLFSERGDANAILSSAVEHIDVALENDLLLVAPATANLLAQFAHGLAGDFLTTMHLAFTGPVLLAPAMNTNMWNHAATQANLRLLRERGYHVVGPDAGDLACGMVGAGRLAEPLEIADAATALLDGQNDLAGETILITAGPTQEAIDPVRVITNRSSGKMGYALAANAAQRGAKVILVSGPVALAAPAQVEMVRVESAEQMKNAVLHRLPEASVFIGVAAVADYRPANPADQKMKKTASRLSIELEPTADILAEVGRLKGDRIVIGFAAETQNLIAEASRKLNAKNCDMVVANLVGGNGTGFEGDENEVLLVTRDAEPQAVSRAAKSVVAAKILDRIPGLRLAAHAEAR
ncbi:bifunctional phosphopantothenoylcysteine decarboxylase/phosphopantothenate--cysteine ligase CoaBC [Bryobacter aggregatus]|uniref:bifunctional phosphopantothenoylcysteine decarboxylase/phosphopantothenate--cysteine ligase CoaBC n=1 Tax=Bryobacter aggregatus TaxID=360054 RepID=UPI0004E286AB|nr:bifunctional phosphopantothenoylcysteine decarboxylase/phosphopantothenate--cysteine ligase CoaBC [Bryobacter aggregatus]